MGTALDSASLRPLPARLPELDNPLETIESDVRAYGILIPDVSRRGALQFAHKSFFEFLFARICAFKFMGNESPYWTSIFRAIDVDHDPIFMNPEIVTFFSQIVAAAIVEETRPVPIGKDTTFSKPRDFVVRRLYDRFVVIQTMGFLGRYTWISYLGRLVMRGFAPFALVFRSHPKVVMVSMAGLMLLSAIFANYYITVRHEWNFINFITLLCLIFLLVIVQISVMASPNLARRLIVWRRCALLGGCTEAELRTCVGGFVNHRLTMQSGEPPDAGSGPITQPSAVR
jgi:hypothetical protein